MMHTYTVVEPLCEHCGQHAVEQVAGADHDAMVCESCRHQYISTCMRCGGEADITINAGDESQELCDICADDLGA